ncbi:MAG: hypothetical protein J0H50_09995 [Xanthomonadales bacterium]|jgi:hypothetical protein|nr:hypothetical protein [Xanthomonadales bacterium]
MSASPQVSNVVYLKPRRKKPHPTAINYRDLAGYCDSPERDGDVQVMLRADYWRGFSMLVLDDRRAIRVVDDNNRPHRFRTLEVAMDELIDVPFIAERIIVDCSRWK